MNVKHVALAQEKHYSDLFLKHGNAPMGTSSESLAHKDLRYRKIIECINLVEGDSVHDVGFGLGAFYDFLDSRFSEGEINYSGSEVTLDYVEAVRKRVKGGPFLYRNLASEDIANEITEESYDYVVMSGVFHQIQETKIQDWEEYAQKLLANSFKLAKKALVFNFVSPYVEYKKVGIYYADINKLIEFINAKMSRFFVVRHDYALYEFTVVVFDQSYIRSKSSEPEFQKYF